MIDGDTLEIISLPNYFGSSSMSDCRIVSSDAFKIDVAPRQDPPSAFNWIGSLTDTIRVDIQNQFAEPLVLRWSESYERWMVSMLLIQLYYIDADGNTR